MFLSHIALSLELISLALGSLLVLKCCLDCGVYHYSSTRESDAREQTSGTETTKKGHRYFGFLKVIGYFIIICSILGFLCTSISYISYLSKYGFAEEFPEYRQRIDEPYDNRPVPKVPEPTAP